MAENWLEEIGFEAINRLGSPELKRQATGWKQRMSEDQGQRLVALEMKFDVMEAEIGGIKKQLNDMERESEKRGERTQAKLDTIASKVETISSDMIRETGRREGEAKTLSLAEKVANWMLPLLIGVLAYAAVAFIKDAARLPRTPEVVIEDGK